MMPVASVVVPAHDEQAVVGRLLAGLLRGARPGELEVIVVCNGCTDDTAGVVRRMAARHPEVRCVEISRASKVAALNAGDDVATSFPRIYLDADVMLSAAGARRLAEVLDGPWLAAGPRLRHDLRGRPWGVRRYYAVWTRLPALQDGYVGSGCFALSAAGRARFERFPDLVADDQFVRTRFRPQERCSPGDVHVDVSPPRTLRAVVQRGIRVRAGNVQLLRAEGRGVGLSPHGGGQRELLTELGRQPRWWPALVVYVAVQGATRAGAWRRLRSADPTAWTRDDTSRLAGQHP